MPGCVPEVASLCPAQSRAMHKMDELPGSQGCAGRPTCGMLLMGRQLRLLQSPRPGQPAALRRLLSACQQGHRGRRWLAAERAVQGHQLLPGVQAHRAVLAAPSAPSRLQRAEGGWLAMQRGLVEC